MAKDRGMLGDIIPLASNREDGIKSISTIATYMVLGYTRSEVANMVGISENDLASVLSANADLFRREFERNRSLLMVNLESKVFKKIDDILSYDDRDGMDSELVNNKVKLINGVMNLICKLQEKRVSVKTEHKATKVVVDFAGMSVAEKQEAIKKIQQQQLRKIEEKTDDNL